MAHIQSTDTDFKKKGEQELKLLGNDLQPVDNVILEIIQDSLKDFNLEFQYTGFMKIFKEKCQNSWDPLFEEYLRIKSLRYLSNSFVLVLLILFSKT